MNRTVMIAASAVSLIVILSVAMLVDLDESDREGEDLYRGFDALYRYSVSGSTSDTYASVLEEAVCDSGTLFLQSALEGYPLKGISSGAFRGCASDTVVVPSTIESVDEGAFDGFDGTVVFLGGIPDGFDGSGGRFLAPDTRGGTVATLVESGTGWSVTYLVWDGDAIVLEAEGSGSLDMPDEVVSPDGTVHTVTMIGCDSFRGSSFDSVTMPSSLERVCARAFYGCDSLEEAVIPMTLESVEDEAFRHCTGLGDTDLGSVRFIGFEAFRDCRSITSIQIPDSVTFMGAGAFYICSSAESATVGAGIRGIPDRAFGYGSSLREVTIEGNVSSVGAYAFFMCKELERMSIQHAETIGNDAFTECRMLSEVVLGAVESIGSNAFENCRSLVSIELPGTLERMGGEVFLGCRSLEDIWFHGPMPIMDGDSLAGTSATIHVSSEHICTWDGFPGTVEPFGGDQTSWRAASPAADLATYLE